MKMNVVDKTERLVLGDIIELRGNFTEVQREEGISYECDYYRTTDKNATFEQMHCKQVAVEALNLLDATDYKIIKAMEKLLVEQGLVESREPLREVVRMG
jgi:hypothetical protein